MSPSQFYFEDGLDTLFEGSPMLLPFQDDEFGYGLGEVRT